MPLASPVLLCLDVLSHSELTADAKNRQTARYFHEVHEALRYELPLISPKERGVSVGDASASRLPTDGEIVILRG